MATPSASPSDVSAGDPKPRDEDLDLFGITHPGKVRKENQDHFLICTLHKTIRVRSTSLPNPELLEMPSQRLASFSMVADGVGGAQGGETASRSALEAIASYATHAMSCFYAVETADEHAFYTAFEEAARQAHQAVVGRAEAGGDLKGMSTTLTAAIAIWPILYVLNVGDSRCYRFRAGVLEQLTRDQTVAQDLVDSGILPPANAGRSPFAHVLSSSIGGTTRPVVTKTMLQRGDILLLSTDGLTKHVSQERIVERLGSLHSSEEAARGLIQDALDGGGSDNVTVLVARSIR